jgi:hypothetical protein
MDYRYYRAARLEIPPILVKHLHLLRYLGVMMIASLPVLGLLLLLKLVELSLFWVLVFFLTGGFGPVVFIIGMAYNSVGDRGVTKNLLWQIRHIGEEKVSNAYRPGRKMIYDHYETPESSDEVRSSGK